MFQMTTNIDEVRKQFKENEQDFLHEVGEFCVDKMNYYAAEDTGYMKSRNDYTVEGNEVALHNDCEYAIYQELGTYKMAAHPFIEPAAMNHLDDIEDIAREALSNGLR